MGEKLVGINEAFKQELLELIDRRDELRIQINMGSREARVEWNQLNLKFKELEKKLSVESERIKEELEEATVSINQKAAAVSEQARALKIQANEDLTILASLLAKDFGDL